MFQIWQRVVGTIAWLFFLKTDGDMIPLNGQILLSKLQTQWNLLNPLWPEDPVYQHVVLGPKMQSQVNPLTTFDIKKKQRSLGSILMPPAPVGFKRMRREQEKAFEKRTDDLLAVFVYLYLYFYLCLYLYFYIYVCLHQNLPRHARVSTLEFQNSTGFAPFSPSVPLSFSSSLASSSGPSTMSFLTNHTGWTDPLISV